MTLKDLIRKRLSQHLKNKVFRGNSDFDRTNYFLDSLIQIEMFKITLRKSFLANFESIERYFLKLSIDSHSHFRNTAWKLSF